MEQNKETEWQDILEKLGFNDPSQVKILETCRVLKHTKIRCFVRHLLMEVRNPDLFRINKLIDAAFRNELGAIDRNVPIWEVLRPQIPYKTKIEQPPKRIFVNTTDEAKLFPMIYDYCKEELEKVRTAEWMREKALKYLSLYYEEWKKGQQVAPEPPQVAPEPPQTRKKTRGKGRQTTPLTMIDDADGHKLERMHQVLKGKIGKDAALYVLAAMKKGWMTRPTYTQVVNEFGDIGSKQGFNNYLGKEQAYTNIELEGAINSLE